MSEKIWEEFRNAIIHDDKMEVIKMMNYAEIIGIADGTKVKYLGELKAFSGVAKIKILEGEWKGHSGYTFKSNLY